MTEIPVALVQCVAVMCVFILVGRCAHGIVWNTVPNSRIDLKETIREVTRFSGQGDSSGPDYFKNVLVDGDYMLVGAKNFVYNISLSTLEQKDYIEWESSGVDRMVCTSWKKTTDECQNYIRVIIKTSENEVFICGTNAFKPYCRTYLKQPGGGYFVLNDQNGIGKCPFDPADNNTATYVQSANRIFTATVADLSSSDALIYGKPLTRQQNDLPELRTEQYNSKVLSEPNFIDSFEYEDMMYFFFRETAVEATNCGKTVYSRVARVCTNDQGGQYLLQTSWTSFFKSRLNCSIPGNFPFYFNEIQSTSGIGQGNYMPAISLNNKTEMVYAVFNTPQNSIHGSAVCAFRFADIKQTFVEAFKHQEKSQSNWLPVPEAETPQPHPGRSCYNGTQDNDKTLNFIKAHPMMDKAVPAFGGQPLLVHSDPNYRLTMITVDWQVQAADGKLYDVIFVGTDDGRVLKCINKGEPRVIETVIIEEIQVFDNKAPVVNLQVHKNQGRLIVVSKHEIKSVLLQRCHLQITCSGCMALQDPYCAWTKDKVCRKSSTGVQSIQTGKHPECTDNPQPTDKVETPEIASTQASTCAPCPVCTERTPNTEDSLIPLTPKSTERRRLQTSTTMRNDIPQVADPSTGKVSMMNNLKYASYEMALAVFFSVILSLLVGFAAGYLFFRKGYNLQLKRRRDPEEPCNSKQDEKNHRLQKLHEKTDNRYENPHVPNHTNLNHLSPPPPPLQNPNQYSPGQQNSLSSLPDNRAQLNVVLNDINCKSSPGKTLNENIETSTSPNHKIKKQVYL